VRFTREEIGVVSSFQIQSDPAADYVVDAMFSSIVSAIKKI
jgi:hypothetical protein